MSFRLYTLGRSAAVIRERAVEPSAELLFAGLLLFGLEPGRDLARRELAELLWPDAGPIRQGARLRWLLNRLKSLGVPLDATARHVRLTDRRVDADYHDVAALSLDAVGPVLAGYAPTFSAPFSRWLDDRRDMIRGEVLRQLVPRLSAARNADDWPLADAVAAALQRVDPFNEEAVLTLAEAQCRRGSKAQAVASLDAYMEALGEDATDLRVPATALRRRIVTQPPSGDAPAFVGRAREIDRLSAVVSGACRGAGGSLLIVGPTGVGKTRLIDEALSRQVGHRLQVVRASWDNEAPSAERLAALARAALNLSGALAAPPDSFQRVTALAGPGADSPDTLDISDSALLVALLDVLDAAAAETPVVLVVDGVRITDPSVLDLFRRLAAWTTTHPAALFVSTRSSRPDARASDLGVLRVGPMLMTDAAALTTGLLSRADRPSGDDVRDRLLAHGAGNPLFLRELVAHWSRGGSLDEPPPSLIQVLNGTLATLSLTATRVLETAVVLAEDATTERIDGILQLPRSQLLNALAELEASGTVASDEQGALYGQSLWTTAIAANSPASIVHLLRKYAGECLGPRARRTPPVHARRTSSVLRRLRRYTS